MNSPVTASQLYSHLACPHRVAMDAVGDATAHGHALVAGLAQPFLDLSALHGDEKEAATREAVARGEPLIYGARLSVHGLLGEPHLLRREAGGYVAIDIKSGAGDEDNGGLRRDYGVQLALYTDILEQMGLSAGRHGYIWDARRAEVRYELGKPLGPRSPCLWELYLKTRQAVRETLAQPAGSRAALAVSPGQGPYLTRSFDWPVAPVEIFFDVETDPVRDLCYLHGFLVRERDNAGATRERFEGLFAQGPDAAAEREVFAAAMALFRRHPGALLLHYSKYERTAYRRLAARHPGIATREEIEALFAAPRALDLYFDVVKSGTEWPVHDFSIRSLAKYCGFRWRAADPSGVASMEWFDQWADSRDPALRQRLLDYNEDDCIAMRVLWDRVRMLPVHSLA